jgi:diguanylate cyclase (GGDEF)-like protein/PAS domain S-box-containing protein
MNTNNANPDRPEETQPLSELFSEVFHVVDAVVDGITDAEIDDRLRQLLAGTPRIATDAAKKAREMEARVKLTYQEARQARVEAERAKADAHTYLVAAVRQANRVIADAQARAEHIIAEARSQADDGITRADQVVADARELAKRIVAEAAPPPDALRDLLDDFHPALSPHVESILTQWRDDPDPTKAALSCLVPESGVAWRTRLRRSWDSLWNTSTIRPEGSGATRPTAPTPPTPDPARGSAREHEVALYRDLADTLADDGRLAVYFVDRARRITYWSQGAERLTGYRATQVEGRSCWDCVLSHVDASGTELCSKACPLRMSILDGRCRKERVYLRHHEGHRQPVLVWTSPRYDQGGTIIGAMQVFSDETTRIQTVEPERTDALTGLGNRAYMEGYLGDTLRERKDDRPFGVLVADVDLFQQVNEAHGYDVGDRALKMVARTLAYGLRGGDVVARYGTQQFVVVLHGAEAAGLGQAAERLRRLVAASRLPTADRPVEVTISLGGTLATRTDNTATLLRRAEEQLCAAKQVSATRGTNPGIADGVDTWRIWTGRITAWSTPLTTGSAR